MAAEDDDDLYDEEFDFVDDDEEEAEGDAADVAEEPLNDEADGEDASGAKAMSRSMNMGGRRRRRRIMSCIFTSTRSSRGRSIGRLRRRMPRRLRRSLIGRRRTTGGWR